MIGVPPIAGFVSKWYLASGALAANQEWIVAVLIGSSLLNAAYFLPILYIVWFKPQQGPWPHEHAHPRYETSLALLIPPLFTAAAALVIGLLAAAPFSPLDWAQLIAQREYRQ
jgi:multicomponent Na+:H+ antiporter subunit D